MPRSLLGGVAIALSLAAVPADAGGPLNVRSDGTPYVWSTASPVQYWVDGGSLGLWNNATALANVQQAFNRWGPDVPTSALTFSHAGGLPGDGDVNTVAEFNALDGVCNDGVSAVIFDANGTLFSALGLPSSLIGFAGPDCAASPSSNILTEATAAFNGKWYDGNLANGELTEAEFKGLLIHEFGHWLNLDHSQTNGHYYMSDADPSWTAFGAPPLSSVEIMFPFAIGGAATTPRKDDIATISRLYPSGTFASTTGSITGTILNPNGVTPFRGADVIARNVADPFNDAVSNVSGVPFSIPSSVGAYELPGLTPGASYAVEVVRVNASFTAGSNVGPLDPPVALPGPEEFYNGVNEAGTNPPDNPSSYTTVAATAGSATSGINVVLNGASVDLALAMTDSPDPVAVGANLTYILTVTNTGSVSATAVTLTDTLPAGVTFVSATPTFGSCTQASGTVTCDLGSMGGGVSRTVTIVVTPMSSGTVANNASVFSNENDPNSSNNAASAITTVDPGADVSVTQTDVPDPVAVGGTVTYSITVTNNGPDTTSGVTLTDTLPTATTFISVNPSQGTCTAPSGGTFTCSLGSLSNGANATITLAVLAGTAGMIGNTASVMATQADPNLANNTSTAATNVGDVSRLINLSTRGPVLTSPNVVYGGFILRGDAPKKLLIRGRGPSMGGAPFNVSGTLDNPQIEVYSGQTVIARNDNWQTTDPLCLSPATACGDASEVLATGLDPCQPNPGQSVSPPGCTNEAAVVLTLPPGPYSVVMSGVNGGTGIGLFGVTEIDSGTIPRLGNVSTRGVVQASPNLMHGGFIVGAGSGSKTVVIRGRGPSMSGAPFNVPGTLANPRIELYSGGTVIAQNDNWQTTDPLCLSPAVSCGTAAQIAAMGLDPCVPNPGQTVAPPGCTNEAALLVTLPPGPYNVVISGVGNTTGAAIVGVTEVLPDLAITSASIVEGNSGTGVASFTVTLSSASTTPVTVNYATTNGSATAPSDYTATSGTLTIPAGSLSGTISVMVNGDTLYEGDESFTVTLSAPTNAIIDVTQSVGIGMVMNDDPFPNQPPVANAGGPYGGVVGEVLTFSAVGSVDPNGDALTYSWNFGDGGTAVGASVTHAYATAGTFSVTITATDPGSLANSATTTTTISVFNPSNNAPTASVTVPSQGLVLQNLTLVGSATDPDNDAMTYSWNFGDGNVSAFGPTSSAVHEYAQAGTYTATLTANDGQGHSVSASGTVTITVPARPVAYAQSPLILRRTDNIANYVYRVAIELDGAGVPPLQFNIVSYPTHWASDAQTLNVAYGNVYQWWDPIANRWRPECYNTVSVPPSCAAPMSALVNPSNGLLTMVPSTAKPTVSYLPERCWVWDGLSDSFTFTVTDGNGVTSDPAVVAISLSNTTCHPPTF
ncbi:MAG: PKD domain-containing protein [Nitrospirota bacterium]